MEEEEINRYQSDDCLVWKETVGILKMIIWYVYCISKWNFNNIDAC